MSDTPQGEGWWMASDGRWYPPTATSGPAPSPPPTYGGPGFAPGQPYYPYAGPQYPPRQTSGKSIAVMVLGIASLVLSCGYGIGVIPAIVALVLAPGAKREIRDSGGRLQGEGQITAGVICSWVSVGLATVGIILVIVLIAVSSTSSK